MAQELEVERLVTRLMGDSSDLVSQLENAKQEVLQYAKEVEEQSQAEEQAAATTQLWAANLRNLGQDMMGIGQKMKQVFGGKLLQGLMAAGEFEKTNIAFGTMIGNVKETQQTLADLTEFAALTPFEMPEIESAARGLIQFGERGDDLMETLNMLGNAAAGSSTDFGFLALVFNQVRGVGKLLTQDFRQLSTRGIISLKDIADHFNVTTEAAQKMLSAGQISFEDLRAILKGLSEEGGRFENLMEKQSQSLLGLWSTYKDAMNITSRDMANTFLPVAKQVVSAMIGVAEWMRNLPTAAKATIAAIGGLGYGFGILIEKAGMSLIVVSHLVANWGALKSAAIGAMNAMRALNVTLTATQLLSAALVGVGIGVLFAALTPLILASREEAKQFKEELGELRQRGKRDVEALNEEFQNLIKTIRSRETGTQRGLYAGAIEDSRKNLRILYEDLTRVEHMMERAKALEGVIMGQFGVRDFSEQVSQAAQILGVSQRDLAGKLPTQQVQILETALKNLKEVYEANTANVKSLQGAMEELKGSAETGTEAAQKMIDKLRKATEQYGMTREQIEIDEAKRAGASAWQLQDLYDAQDQRAQIEGIQAFRDEIFAKLQKKYDEEMKQRDRLSKSRDQEAKQIRESAKRMMEGIDPVAKFKAAISDLNKHLGVMGEGFRKTYDVYAQKAFKEMKEGLEELEKKSQIDVRVTYGGNESVKRGSAELRKIMEQEKLRFQQMDMAAKVDAATRRIVGDDPEFATRSVDSRPSREAIDSLGRWLREPLERTAAATESTAEKLPITGEPANIANG